MGVFERAFLRGGIEIAYTEGFNPKPKLEFANPLTLGFESEDEIAAIEIMVEPGFVNENIENDFIKKMNSSLPVGMRIVNSRIIKSIADEKTGKKVKSLMASYGGGTYVMSCAAGVDIRTVNDTADALSKKEGTEVVRIEGETGKFIVKTGKDQKGRILNIFKFLSGECGFEHPFDKFEIKRTISHCSISSEKKEKTGDDYFSCYL